MKSFVSTIAALLVCATAHAQDLVPERHIQGNVIISDHDPAIGR